MIHLHQFVKDLWEIIIEMSPYLLLGFLFAGILKVWFPQRWIDQYMGKRNFSSVFNAALLGVPLPLCSCGVIPAGISFYRNGASKGSSVSFFISTPQTGIDSILVTYSLLGLPFALIRVIVAFFTGVAGGVITNLADKHHLSETIYSASGSQPTHLKQKHPIYRVFHYGFFEFLMDIAKWLVIGLLIAALISVVIPDNFFTMYLDNDWLSMFLVLIASVPMYICATASVPIAAVLMLKGLSPGAALVFLMAGPATNAATITMVKKVFGNKTLYSYLSSIIFGALLAGMAINQFLPREWFVMDHHVAHSHAHHEMLPIWVQQGSAILLTLLILNGYLRKWMKNKLLKKTIPIVSPSSTLLLKPDRNNNPGQSFQSVSLSMASASPVTTIEVSGMTCNHCKASVETNLSKLRGITKVTANPQLNKVFVEGTSIDWKEVENVISQLGYTYNGKMT